MTPPLPPGIADPRPYRRVRGIAFGLLAFTLLAWSPALSVLFTASVAGALGCRVDEAGVHPCPGPFGIELGGLLSLTGTMGWLMLVTWPFMLGSIVAWVGLAGWGLWRWLRRR